MNAPASRLVLQLAPTGRRLTAVLVDGALDRRRNHRVSVGGRSQHSAIRLRPKIAEISGGLRASARRPCFYQTLFLALAEATPGMKCAGIKPVHLRRPKPHLRHNRGRRLGALLLSVLPLGWA